MFIYTVIFVGLLLNRQKIFVLLFQYMSTMNTKQVSMPIWLAMVGCVLFPFAKHDSSKRKGFGVA